jgi:hypothetical protein
MNWQTATREQLLAELATQCELGYIAGPDRLNCLARLELTATTVLRSMVQHNSVLIAHEAAAANLRQAGADVRAIDRAIERLRARARA